MENVLDQIKTYYLEWLPFNKVLGISIDDLDYEDCSAVTSFPMKPDLIGNSAVGILHGGVTAAVIDLTGGLSALVSCVRQNETASAEELQTKLFSSATVDMRVDYLRPGKGESFTCKSRLIRGGSRIVVAKIDLFSNRKLRVATGTAAYMIG